MKRALALALSLVSSAALAAPFDDTLVQPPTLAVPERASLAGSLADLAIGPADLSRGAFRLPAPLVLPGERGRLQGGFLPVYSADAGLSEWGQGWANRLEIRRYREVGELDYASDDLASPWGTLRAGDDGAFYPSGLTQLVQARREGQAWVVVSPDGVRHRFEPGVGGGERIYSWLLAEVVDLDGERSVYTWSKNPSGRPFLARVEWGAGLAYRLEVDYQILAVPLDDHRSGTRLVLDRRVSGLRQLVRRTDSGGFAERWRYRLGHTASASGPGFYLAEVERIFASGAHEPTVSYAYDTDDLDEARDLLDLPELDGFLEAGGTDALAAEHTTGVDLDDDGLVELEHADSMQLFSRQAGEWQGRPLAVAADADDLCLASPTRAPRLIVRLAPGQAPHRVVGWTDDDGGTRFVVCDLAGRRLSESRVDGNFVRSPRVRLADVDRDLRPDLVRVTSGRIAVLRNTGGVDELRFQPRVEQQVTPRFNPEAVWIDDATGDGVADVIARGASGFVVWAGRGGLAFETEGRRLGVFDRGGHRLVDLAGLAITWVDANRDGLLDLLTTRGGAVKLYTSDGTRFAERSVLALAALSDEPGLPLHLDLSGRGESEVVLVHARHARALAFTSADNGLLVAADDGKGTRAELGWRRADAAPGLGRRPAVLDRLTVSSAGRPPVTTSYDYQRPELHSLARFLLGFSRVSRIAPLSGEDLDFHHDDDVQGLEVGSTTSDALTPGVYHFRSQRHDDRRFHGLPYKRLAGTREGWRRLDGSAELAVASSVGAYEREICASETLTHDPAGTLTRTIGLAAPIEGIPAAIDCRSGDITLRGRHADPGLDFVHAARLDRDARGHLERVVSTQGTPLVLQELAYRADGKLDSVRQGDLAPTTLRWDEAGTLFAVDEPDGTASEATRDPLSDAIVRLTAVRGDRRLARSYAYDGLERLWRSWNGLSGSFAEPLEETSYRYASDAQPALLHVRQRFAAGHFREQISLQSAGGDVLGQASRFAGGWAFGELARVDGGERTATALVREPSADPAELSFQALYAGATWLGEAQQSASGDVVRGETTYAAGAVRRTATTRAIEAGFLVTTTVENDRFTVKTRRDAAGRVVEREDQDGQVTRMAHDVLGRPVQVSLADGSRQFARYDAHGRLAESRRDGLGRVVYTYAPGSGLLTGKTFHDADGRVERDVQVGYDAAGRPTSELLTQPRRFALARFDYTYDGKESPVPLPGELGFATRIAGDGFEKRYRHRPDGQAASEVVDFPGWRRVETELVHHDDGTPSGRIVRLRDASGSLLQELREETRLDRYGRPAALEIDGVEVATYQYDERGRLLGLDLPTATVRLRRDPTTRQVSGYSLDEVGLDWTRGARGQIASETRSQQGESRERVYAYDARGLLLGGEDGNESTAYHHDVVGLADSHRDARGERRVVRGERSLGAGGETYQLDALGRVIARGELHLEYGPSGQIERARRGSTSWSYLYDEVGARLARLDDGVITRAWVADGLVDAGGYTRRIEVAGQTIGWVDAAGFHALLADPRGTPISDGGGFDLPSPYGVRERHPGVPAAFDYAGSPHDDDLGVIRMGQRDYDPLLGRFLTPDPAFLESLDACAASPVECNLYGYAAGDPIRFVDPTGLGVGHHYVAENVTRVLQSSLQLSPEAAAVFRASTTGWPDGITPHGYSMAHKVYDLAVKSEFTGWATRMGIDPSKMSAAEAEEFVHVVRTSPNRFIRGFIQMHEWVVKTASSQRLGPQVIERAWQSMRTSMVLRGGFGARLLAKESQVALAEVGLKATARTGGRIVVGTLGFLVDVLWAGEARAQEPEPWLNLREQLVLQAIADRQASEGMTLGWSARGAIRDELTEIFSNLSVTPEELGESAELD